MRIIKSDTATTDMFWFCPVLSGGTRPELDYLSFKVEDSAGTEVIAETPVILTSSEIADYIYQIPFTAPATEGKYKIIYTYKFLDSVGDKYRPDNIRTKFEYFEVLDDIDENVENAYCGVLDIKAEIPTTTLTNQQILDGIKASMQEIEQITGWFFGARHLIYDNIESDYNTLFLNYPCIFISQFWDDDNSKALFDDEDAIVHNLNLIGLTDARRILEIEIYNVDLENYKRISIEGIFGVVQEGSAPWGLIPSQIKRACLRLTLMSKLFSVLDDEIVTGYVKRMKTKDQEVEYNTEDVSVFTGDLVIDAILGKYMTPPRVC